MDLECHERCTFDGCSVREPRIRMFLCRSCSKQFCGEHRLTLAHNCCVISELSSDDVAVGTSSSSAMSQEGAQDELSIRGMLKAIETRHSDVEKITNQRQHFRAKTGIIEQSDSERQKEEAFWKKLDGQLAAASDETKTLKSRSLAAKTAHMLMKMKAQGDQTSPEKRLYFIVEFVMTGTKSVVYLSRDFSISEGMIKLARQFTTRSFGAPCVPEGCSLCPHSMLHSDWRDAYWDRRRRLSEVINEFESIMVSCEVTSEVAMNQKTIEENAPTAFKGSVFSSQAHQFGVGNKVLYKSSDGTSVQSAVVAAVHHDDYPNTYYTIVMDDGGSERQTVALRLEPNEVSLDLSGVQKSDSIVSNLRVEEGDIRSITVTASYSGKSFFIEIDPHLPVRDLKGRIASVMSISSEKLRLVCRGTWLKNDDALIKETKVENGAKITCMVGK